MLEYRQFTIALPELREEGHRVIGIAAPYLTLSANLGGFREKIAPSAFERSLKENDIRCLYAHDSSLLLGRTSNQTLKLTSEEAGLGYDVAFPNTSYANDLLQLLIRGDVCSCSFGFFTRKDAWAEDPESGLRIRTLIDVDLREISFVGDPAYPTGTTAAVIAEKNHFARQAVELAKRRLVLCKRRAQSPGVYA